jgi:hypothetical protein
MERIQFLHSKTIDGNIIFFLDSSVSSTKNSTPKKSCEGHHSLLQCHYSTLNLSR